MKLLLPPPITAEHRQKPVIRLVLAMVQYCTRDVTEDLVLIQPLMVILIHLMTALVMAESAALLITAGTAAAGIQARHVQLAVALRVMAAETVILIHVQAVLVQLPVLRVAGQPVRVI